jgi:hypothetical protein
LSFKFNNLQQTHRFPVQRSTAAALRAPQIATVTAKTRRFFTVSSSYFLQELWLASACQGVMSNEAIGELGWTRRCVAADRKAHQHYAWMSERPVSLPRSSTTPCSHKRELAPTIVAQLPPALARRIDSLARRADVFDVGVTAAEPQAVIVTKDEDFAASCS